MAILTITMPRWAYITFKIVKISVCIFLSLLLLNKVAYQFEGFFSGLWACLAIIEIEKTVKSLRCDARES